MSVSAIGVSAVAIAIICEAGGQILFKQAAALRRQLTTLLSQRNALIATAIVMLICEGFAWSIALRNLDVSVAYPLGSLELVVVVFLARLLLGEKVGPRRWIGIALIFAGTLLVGVS